MESDQIMPALPLGYHPRQLSVDLWSRIDWDRHEWKLNDRLAFRACAAPTSHQIVWSNQL